jgi:hypothetical protein
MNEPVPLEHIPRECCDLAVRANPAAAAWEDPGWKQAAEWYHDEIKKRGSALIVELEPERLAQARQIIDSKAIPDLGPHWVAEKTFAAAEYLIKQNDPARLRLWLAKRSIAERRAIEQHLREKK